MRVISEEEWQKINDHRADLGDRFPTLYIRTHADYPYEQVQVIVRDIRRTGEFMFSMKEPIDEFPTDLLITKLMLAS